MTKVDFAKYIGFYIKDISDKAAIIRFWEGTKIIPHTLLAICGIHDQDTVVAVYNLDESRNNLKETKVERKSCCENAADNALKRIHHALAWVDYLQKYGTPEQEEPIKILEIDAIETEETKLVGNCIGRLPFDLEKKIGQYALFPSIR